MKTDNLDRPGEKSHGTTRGRSAPARAGAGPILWVRPDGTEYLAWKVRAPAVTEIEEGLEVQIGGEGSSNYTNDSGAAVNVGDVGTIIGGTFVTTTTAQYTGLVGVVVVGGEDGDDILVQTSGPVAQINLTASGTEGEYVETSTTAGLGETNATARAGSFGVLTSTGLNPSAYLFGITYLTGGGAGGGVPGWFNVRDYGALGDATTDDTAAINDAIAALIAAGKGVLYFPASSYKTTATLDDITVPCTILGDGGTTSYDGSTSAVSMVFTASTTDSVFRIDTDAVTIRGLAIVNAAVTTPTAGAGVEVVDCYGFQMLDCTVKGFYDCVSVAISSIYRFAGVYFIAPVRYGLRLRNTSVGDNGDGMITDCWFYATARHADAAIRIESGGGIKILNCYINSLLPQLHFFARGIDVANATVTSQLRITAVQIENVTEDGIHIVSNGSSIWDLIEIIGCGIHLYRSSAANRRAVSISTDTLGNIKTVLVYACTFRNASAQASTAAMSFTKITDVAFGAIALSSAPTAFSAQYIQSGCSGVYDQTGGVAAGVSITGTPSSGDVPIASSSTTAAWGTVAGGVTGFATPAVVLGTAAAAGAATTVIRSDATILAFDATVPAAIGTAATGSQATAARRDHVHPTGAGTPSTQALGDAASTGTGPAAAMTDHKHAMPALSTATPLADSGSGSVGTALPSSREDHVHPAAAGAGDHVHVAGEVHLSDGATTTYTLDAAFESGSVEAWNTTTLAYLTVTETLPDQATVSAAGSSGDKITFNYAASAV